jgi:SAM-dependent methyltransferase
MTQSKHLDIGCGGLPRNPYNANEIHGLDIKVREHSDYQGVSMHEGDAILNGLPFSDNSFDSISAYDFLEHVPRVVYKDQQVQFPFVKLMTEVFRVLRPNGKFLAITPYFPAMSCFTDPTHVNFITIDTHKYFCHPHNWASMYGFEGGFSINEVKKINFIAEVSPPKRLWKRMIYSTYIGLRPKTKQHLKWELTKPSITY